MLHREAPLPTLHPDPGRMPSTSNTTTRAHSLPPNQRGKGNSMPIITIFEQNMPPALLPPMPLEDFKQKSTTILDRTKRNNKQSVGGCVWFEGQKMNTFRERDHLPAAILDI